MKRLSVLAAIALATLPVTTTAASQPSYNVADFDIISMQLGMDHERIERIMRSNGFSVSEANTPFNFEYFVKKEAVRLKQPIPEIESRKGPTSLFGSDSQGNLIDVTFIDSGDAYIAAEIRLTFDKQTNVQSQIGRDLENKYGRPSTLTHDEMNHIWCTAGDPGCKNRFGNEGPIFSHNMFNGHTITLSNKNAMARTRNEKISGLFSKPTADRQRSLLAPN